MEYMTIKEASEKWGIGTRIITVYCSEGRIEGAVKRGNLWLIPKNAGKPEDRRKKEPVKQETEWPFDSLYEDKDLFIEIFKKFPHPMHICAPDGTILVANDAYLRFARIMNPDRIFKKHNILDNPALERWGVKEFIERSFRGEAVNQYDVKVPYQEIVDRMGDNKDIICESLFHNLTSMPIFDSGNQLKYVVFILTVSRSYQDRVEISRGKEYIDNHWKEDFDADKLSETVHVSKYHYTRLFKRHTDITPYQYYKNVKVEKLKERLCSPNITIAQAFQECGLDYNGNFVKVFLQKVGMTPSEYRAKMTKKIK